jgi:hypothetical protein
MLGGWEGFYSGVDAQAVGEVLEKLDLIRNREKIPFEEILAHAQKPTSPLYLVLTRNKDDALRKLNKREIRQMMRNLVIGRRGPGNTVVATKTRAFLWVYPGDEDHQMYMRRQKVNQTPSLRAQQTKKFYYAIRNLAIAYDGNPELTHYVNQINKILKAMSTIVMEHV